ncbi:hypothetical protein, partial [Infirmifilum sp.]|uniref:hypothetical protein n=1 Tax=Infirmifilum sp. TaxID=2856575 RepID=UPI003D096259
EMRNVCESLATRDPTIITRPFSVPDENGELKLATNLRSRATLGARVGRCQDLRTEKLMLLPEGLKI